VCGKIVIYHVVKFICIIKVTYFKSDYVDFLFQMYFLFRFQNLACKVYELWTKVNKKESRIINNINWNQAFEYVFFHLQ